MLANCCEPCLFPVVFVDSLKRTKIRLRIYRIIFFVDIYLLHLKSRVCIALPRRGLLNKEGEGRPVRMLERRKPLDLLFPLKGNAASRTGEDDVRPPTTLDRLRAGVTLARDAVKAVSVTAMEALREGASFIGIVGETNELVDPFAHLDAPIWSEQPPAELHKLAYRYCEELTMREAGNFYHSFKYLPEEQRLAMCAIYAFCRRADDIADGDWADRFPGGKGMLDPEAMEYRNQLESLQDQGTILDEDAYLNKITQLFSSEKKLSTCYGDVHSPIRFWPSRTPSSGTTSATCLTT